MARKKTTPDNRMGVPSARAPQRGEAPDLVKQGRAQKGPVEAPGSEIVQRRATDWMRWQIIWRSLLDSYEGGQRYRDAEYGPDREGRTVRNLVRHKREYPDPHEYPSTTQGIGNTAGAAAGTGTPMMVGPFPGMLGAHPNATAHDDDYEYRRARTPVPDFTKEVVHIHTGKIYDQQISREGPPELKRWWANVDGAGTPIDDWMRETVSPQFLVLGCLDIVFDRKSLPPWVKIETKADEIQNKLDTCAAAVILPVNMPWWNADPGCNFTECLVREYWFPTLSKPDDEGSASLKDNAQAWSAEFPGEARPRDVHFRHWTAEDVTLYTADGEIAEEPKKHGYAWVPITRIFDHKRHRTPMIGAPRYEVITELQRDYYNRSSELILSDTLQASPILTGPPEHLKPDGTVAIGPGYILPKYVGANNEVIGYEYISPQKDPAESIRKNLEAIREQVDRAACLTKPAGVRGTTGGTVSQSGYSKEMDAAAGNKMLSGIAKSLAKAERQIAEFALMCIHRRPLTDEERASIKIVYPSRFQLKPAEAILDELTKVVSIVSVETQITTGLPMPGMSGGSAPATAPPPSQQGGNPQKGSVDPGTPATRYLMPDLIAELFCEYARATLPGRDDEFYNRVRDNAQMFLHLKAPVPLVGTESGAEAMAGHGTEEATAGEDRTGQSAASDVNPYMPLAN